MIGVRMISIPSETMQHPDHCVRGSSLHHRNGETGNAFTPTDRTESLSAVSLHRHRRTDCIGQSLTHLVTTRSQLRTFTHNGGIDIARLEP